MTDAPRRPGRPRTRPIEAGAQQNPHASFGGLGAAVEAPTTAPPAPVSSVAAASTETIIERPAMRPALRAEDPRARAAARAAQLRDHLGDLDEGTDDFYIDPNIIPDGWDYEWKRNTVLGQEDPAYQVQLARGGWEPVPPDRHTSYMPKDWKGATIERKGMVLMERPKEITEEVRRIERRKAALQVRQKEEQLSSAPQGQFERHKSDGSPLAKVKKSYEPMEVPD